MCPGRMLGCLVVGVVGVAAMAAMATGLEDNLEEVCQAKYGWRNYSSVQGLNFRTATAVTGSLGSPHYPRKRERRL